MNIFTGLAWVFVVSGSLLGAHFAHSQLDLDVSAVVGSPTPPGGGGGGSSGSTTGATVVMTGWSFPNAKLTLLKDGSVATTLIANPDGSFQITLNGLSYGNYQLSIYAEDPKGILSSPHVINLLANSNQPYNFSNIIIPPTIFVSPTVVAIGDSYIVSGYAPANSTVSAEIPTLPTLGSATANAQGYYEISLAANLPPGLYGLRTKATFNGYTSLYSRPIMVNFYISEPGLPGEPPVIPPPPPQLGVCVDYNKDRRVNLVDFSILLFWFGKPAAPTTIDCNRDNVIDIKDFSILMYFWTG